MYLKELLKGNTDTLLLALISGERMYGYRLTKEIEKRSSGYFQFKEGTLYPALHRLEKAGLIQGKWSSSDSGPKRRYYEITNTGLKELARKSKEWKSFSNAINLVMSPGR